MSHWFLFSFHKMFKRDGVDIEVKYQQVNESLVFVFFSENVQKRQDCYWGKNCRTQRTRPHHAQ